MKTPEIANQDNIEILSEWDVLGSQELEPAPKEQLRQFRSVLLQSYGVGNVDVLDTHKIDISNLSSSTPLSELYKTEIVEKTLYKGDIFWVSEEYKTLITEQLHKFDVLRSSRAETSAHKVFFGVLHDESNNKGTQVAIKPCPKNSETAISDWLNAKLANELGFRSFQPVGFIMADGIGYSITELEKNVETIDNEDWKNVLLFEEDEQYITQRENLGQIASLMAKMHAKNIYHGDPQFKNIAIDITGDLFFIDWESATFCSEKNEVGNKKAAHDLTILFSSMARSENNFGVGLLESFNPDTQWKFFNDYILTPYFEEYMTLHGTDTSTMEYLDYIENTMKKYILDGELYSSLSRARNN